MNSPIKAIAIIVAAGRGSRMAADEVQNGPKQYMRVGGRTLLAMACDAFLEHPAVSHVIVAIHRDDLHLFDRAIQGHAKLLPPVFGGHNRQESVFNALQQLETALGEAAHETTVLIHDAARPLVDRDLISRVIGQVSSGKGALPGVAVSDTIKRAHEVTAGAMAVSETIDRAGLHLAQTPQAFVLQEILAAHRAAVQSGKTDFTDDCAIAEWHGMSINMVEGDRRNFKITTQDDLRFLNELSGMIPDFEARITRIGNGYDVHRTVDGGPIVLGGLEIQSPIKLDGHSDADVVLHALTDALLGTIAEGDIGSHFPPSDAQWKGAASDRFLAHACALIQRRGGRIENMDVTVICEAPKIGPHRDAMRAKIAEICDIAMDIVSVKATTHERIGTIGRGEGVAALASASVSFVDTR